MYTNNRNYVQKLRMDGQNTDIKCSKLMSGNLKRNFIMN